VSVDDGLFMYFHLKCIIIWFSYYLILYWPWAAIHRFGHHRWSIKMRYHVFFTKLLITDDRSQHNFLFANFAPIPIPHLSQSVVLTLTGGDRLVASRQYQNLCITIPKIYFSQSRIFHNNAKIHRRQATFFQDNSKFTADILLLVISFFLEFHAPQISRK